MKKQIKNLKIGDVVYIFYPKIDKIIPGIVTTISLWECSKNKYINAIKSDLNNTKKMAEDWLVIKLTPIEKKEIKEEITFAGKVLDNVGYKYLIGGYSTPNVNSDFFVYITQSDVQEARKENNLWIIEKAKNEIKCGLNTLKSKGGDKEYDNARKWILEQFELTEVGIINNPLK